MAQLADLLHHLIDQRGSDLLIKVGSPPHLRVNGRLLATEFPQMGPAEIEEVVAELLPAAKAEELIDTGEVDVAHSVAGLGRFRVNVYRQRGSLGLAVRRVVPGAPAIGDLHLPEVVEKMAAEPHGLIIVDRRRRIRSDDHGRRDHRPRERPPGRPHRHARGPHRGAPRGQAVPREPAGDRCRHRIAAERHPPGGSPERRRDLRGRDPRRRGGRGGPLRGRLGTPRRVDDVDALGRGDGPAAARAVPAGPAGAGPAGPRLAPARGDRPAPARPRRRQGPRPGRRGAARHGQDRGRDRRRSRRVRTGQARARGRVLRHADLRPGPVPALQGQPHRCPGGLAAASRPEDLRISLQQAGLSAARIEFDSPPLP